MAAELASHWQADSPGHIALNTHCSWYSIYSLKDSGLILQGGINYPPLVPPGLPKVKVHKTKFCVIWETPYTVEI